MSWTERSTVLKPSQVPGLLTSREDSTCSQQSKRKGISLSKEHAPKHKSRSPAFIKVLHKGKKNLIVERREIKLLLKGRDESQTDKWSNQENSQDKGNVGGGSKDYMGVISDSGVGLCELGGKEFGKFPLKKVIRKERGPHNNMYPSIQLF